MKFMPQNSYSVTTQIVLFWLLTCCPAIGQTLWQESRSGMSVEEVLQAFPKSRDDSFMVGAVKTAGPVTDEVTIDDFRFKVQFYFTDGRLSRVILSCSEKLLSHEGAAVARHFVDLLRARYGEATKTDDTYLSDPRDIAVAWNTKDFVKISLSYFREPKLGAGAYRLSITYDGKSIKGSEKL